MSEMSFTWNTLMESGPRLPSLLRWLEEDVWSRSRYNSLDSDVYLREGEKAVKDVEELISNGALGAWNELEAFSIGSPTPRQWLGLDQSLPPTEQRAVVVFDGLSIREIPLLLQMAESTGFRIKNKQVIATSLPTETMDFIEQRVLGSRIAPSQLRGRRELAEKNLEAFYLDQPNSREVYPTGKSLLVWSSYPDRLYFNDEARTDQLFSTFHRDHIPVLWKCAVQALPRDLPIVITADHGYIFFGASLASDRDSSALDLLKQGRNRRFNLDEIYPENHPDLQLLSQSRTALLRGRLRGKPTGPSGRKLYQHGGFSLMEVLVPWIELERI